MARNFNGGYKYVRLADDPALTLPAGNWSFGCWVKCYSNTGTGYRSVFRYGGWDATPSCRLYLYGEDHSSLANRLYLRMRDASGNLLYSIPSIEFGAIRTWQHLLFVRDGTAFNCYVDGNDESLRDATGFGEVDVASYWSLGDSSLSGIELAECAKWDVALSAEQRTALFDGVRPPEVGTRPAWYLPMLGSLDEEIAGLTVTNSGATISEHPSKIILPGIPQVLQPIRPAIGGPYQVSAMAMHASGTAADQVFSTGTTIGQINGY